MKTNCTQWLLAVVAAMTVLAPSVVVAQEKDEAVKSEGPIVRRKVLYRSTRVEIVPHAAATLNDPFRRNLLAGAGLAYHLTNEFSISASGGYGLVHLETDLSQNITDTLTTSSPGSLNNISYSQMQWYADFSLGYVPIFGKFSVFKSVAVPYDIHLNGGLTIVSEEADPAVDGGNVDAQIEGIRPGGVVGGGARIFLSDMLSLNIDLRTLFITRAPVSSGSASAELKPTAMATVGLGIFFPGSVKISR